MNGSGCKNCPVRPCLTLNYRGSTCAVQREKYGLGDPMTNADKIRDMSDVELTDFLNHWADSKAWKRDPGATKDWLQELAEGE